MNDTITRSSDQTPFWLQDLTILDGVGEKLAEKLEDLLGGRLIRNLLQHQPYRWADRSVVSSIADLIPDEIQTVRAEVQNLSLAVRGSKLQKVRLADETGFLTLVFFNSNSGYLQKQFPEGRKLAVSGLVEDFYGQRQITHPEYVVDAAKCNEIPPVEPIYPLTAGITNRRLHSLILAAMNQFPELTEWHSASLLQKHDWPALSDALQTLHAPSTLEEDKTELAIERLAYDEALTRALIFRRYRNNESKLPAMPFPEVESVKSEFVSSLTYAPTSAQARAMMELANDLALDHPMQRMLQGDVGSGKTTIAAFACALASRNGFQTAVMAPTEVLARQLHRAISDMIEPLGIRTACLTGGTKTAERRNITASTANGTLNVLCGTHALFQDKIEFHSLGLVIIDEQHRFGVNDRARLASKGVSPHLMIMSATPIPRSLAMTIHGDLDLSILDEKPVGRLPIETRTVPDTRLEDVITAVERAISRKEQVFWVCPRVEEDEEGRSVIARHAMLDDRYEQKVGLIHGRQTSDVKASALEAFRNGETSVLVATTVIEVGVDIPNATIMVIEGAETFGLAQLHQLRGRVGRGDRKSYCILVYTSPLGETARTRLNTLRQSEDGFYIAEVDFQLRGPGDILGLAQSGLPAFRFLDLRKHQGLLAMSQKDAVLRLPEGKTEISEEEQTLICLFGQELNAGPKI